MKNLSHGFSGTQRFVTFVPVLSFFLLGLLDFWTGFVEFSVLRFVILFLLTIVFLPVDLSYPVKPLLAALQKWRRVGYLFLIGLSMLGFVLFLTRYLRHANMGDTFLFKESIENTRLSCLLCNYVEGGSHFRAHNNAFLLALVPLRVLPHWWLVVQLLHSLVIVLWCRVCGWALGGNSKFGWIATIVLFFATYGQHAAFYDTRFAALALTIFAVGFYLRKERLLWLGTLASFLTRETAALNLFMFSVLGFFRKRLTRTMIPIAILALFWFLGSYILMRMLGGPVSAGRLPSCLLGFSQFNLTCVADSLLIDWQLKLAYTLRLIAYAPTLGMLPSLFAIIPDLGITWLSRGDVLYSLSWHHYMQTLGILLVGAGFNRGELTTPLEYPNSNLARWIVAISLWQFVTTVRPNLF